MRTYKDIEFLGDSLECIREFPENARREAGYQLGRIQQGLQPDDFKPMQIIGAGVEEIRIRDNDGAFRVFYIARKKDVVYVLHAFKKKTQATPKREIEIAKKRYREIL